MTRPLASLLAATALAPLLASTSQAVVLYYENFDAISLGPTVTFGDSDNAGEFPSRTAWSSVPPAGWGRDASLVPGDSIADGVQEFRGWTFLDKAWWTRTAGDQNRSQFRSGYGVVAVADPDEFDDYSSGTGEGSGPIPEGCQGGVNCYDSTITTPSISLAGVAAGQARLVFDSSWRPEDVQKAAVQVSFNGGAFSDLYKLESVSSTGEPSGIFTKITDSTGAQVGDLRADNTNLNDTVDLALNNPAGASSVQVRFRLYDAGNDWWWAVDNLQVYTGTAGPRDPALRLIVNRDTGDVQIVNHTPAAVQLRGYQVLSTDGTLDSNAAQFLADTNPNWVQLTAPGATTDLSEGHLSSTTLAQNGVIDLGPGAWDRYYKDLTDTTFQYLVSGSNAPKIGLVEFVGNGGATYDYLDLNYDGVIDILDWETFKVGYGKNLTGLTLARRYGLGDLDGDGRHTGRDFLAFKDGFNAANGAGAFERLLAVPEPSTLGLALASLAGFAARRRRRVVAVAAAAIAAVGLAGRADAQVTIYSEDFEGVPLGPPIEETGVTGPQYQQVVSLAGPAGWTVDNSGMPGFGDPTTDGVRDFAGWTFVNKDWWALTAGDQDRSQFTRASGTVLLADPDEWDDQDGALRTPIAQQTMPPNWYDSFAKTPVIPIPAGIGAGRLKLSFDSSWRPEGFDDLDNTNNQTGTITAIYNGTQRTEVYHIDSDPAGPFFKGNSTNERVTSLDLAYDGVATTLQLDFGLTQAWNDWWWALDNIVVSAFPSDLKLRINTFNGEGFLQGTDAFNTAINFLSIESAGGHLTGATATGLRNAGFAPADGPDAGSVAGNSPGEQWENLSDPATYNNQIAEAFLFGSSVFNSSVSKSLGRIFNTSTPAGSRDVTFSYVLASGDVIDIPASRVEYFFDNTAALPGDFNRDGVVNAADYTVWRDGLGTVYTPADYNVWSSNYGATASVSTSQAVPEPAALVAAAVAVVAARGRRRR